MVAENRWLTLIINNPIIYINSTYIFLNQARAGLRPARVWFLEITLVRTSVCVFVCVCVCVCVSAPEAMNNQLVA